MKKGDNMKKQGFTIIEVALVLGIAGLIFLMMMIALPALQRQSRDTARKEDIDSLIANIKKYQTNNRGALPDDTNPSTSWTSFFGKYMDDGFVDPSGGERYDMKILSCPGEKTSGGVADEPCTGTLAKNAIEDAKNDSFADSGYKMYVITSAKCADNEDLGAVRTLNPRKVAVLYKLEGGGLYCANT